MRTTDKVKLIKHIHSSMEAESWEAINMTLKAFGFPEVSRGQWEDEPTVMESLSEGSDDQLEQLAIHYEVPLPAGVSGAGMRALDMEERTPRALKIFGSHCAQFKFEAHAYATEFRRFGVEMFIAHDDIQLTRDWKQSIVDALRDTDAAVILHRKGIEASVYCQQEIGWLMGQRTPMIGLKADRITNPTGFDGAQQAMTPPLLSYDPSQIDTRATVMKMLSTFIEEFPQLHIRTFHSLAKALKESDSFDSTRRIWDLIKSISSAPENESIVLMKEAAEQNNQVFRAREGGYNEGVLVPEALERELKRWKPEENVDEGYDDSPF